MSDRMTVAVIGAGLAGVSASLTLAEAGCEVHLYDRSPEPLSGASARNEGKLHLGYVYAMDPSLRTARAMLQGAETFRAILEPWIGRNTFENDRSPPFIYAVPRDSMLPVEAVRTHFDRVSDLAAGFEVEPGIKRRLDVRELSATDLNAVFDPERVVAAFETEERAVGPLSVRAALLEALTAESGITLRLGAQVEALERGPGGMTLRGRSSEGPVRERYATVVNAAWEQRLRLDASLGLAPTRPVIHRYKCGLRAQDARIATALPCVTFLVGEFGDTTTYGDRVYVSWYPSGLLKQEVSLYPSTEPELDRPARSVLTRETLAGLSALMPGPAAALDPDAADWEVVGGWITAWGRTGIDDSESRLHDRYETGVTSVDGYHSVDSGKFTSAPMHGVEAAMRALGREARKAS